MKMRRPPRDARQEATLKLIAALYSCRCRRPAQPFLICGPVSEQYVSKLYGILLSFLPRGCRELVRYPFRFAIDDDTNRLVVPPDMFAFMDRPRAITIVYWRTPGYKHDHARVMLKVRNRVCVIDPSTSLKSTISGSGFLEHALTQITKRFPDAVVTQVHRSLMTNSQDCSCVFQCISIMIIYFALGESAALHAPIPTLVYKLVNDLYRPLNQWVHP